MADPYELDAHAFTLAHRERADAFDVAADAFEEAGLHSAAAARRSWAQTMRECFIVDWGAIHQPYPNHGNAWMVDGRGTGRTHRMLQAAVDTAIRGQTVVVMVARERDRTAFDDRARAIVGQRLDEIRDGDSPDAVWRRIHVETAESATRNLRGRRVDRVLEDHFYTETKPRLSSDAADALAYALRAVRSRGTGA